MLENLLPLPCLFCATVAPQGLALPTTPLSPRCTSTASSINCTGFGGRALSQRWQFFSGAQFVPPPGIGLDLQGDYSWEGAVYFPTQTSLRASASVAPAFEASFAYSFNAESFPNEFRAHGFVFLLSSTLGKVGSSLYALPHPSTLSPPEP